MSSILGSLSWVGGSTKLGPSVSISLRVSSLSALWIRISSAPFSLLPVSCLPSFLFCQYLVCPLFLFCFCLYLRHSDLICPFFLFCLPMLDVISHTQQPLSDGLFLLLHVSELELNSILASSSLILLRNAGTVPRLLVPVPFLGSILPFPLVLVLFHSSWVRFSFQSVLT